MTQWKQFLMRNRTHILENNSPMSVEEQQQENNIDNKLSSVEEKFRLIKEKLNKIEMSKEEVKKDEVDNENEKVDTNMKEDIVNDENDENIVKEELVEENTKNYITNNVKVEKEFEVEGKKVDEKGLVETMKDESNNNLVNEILKAIDKFNNENDIKHIKKKRLSINDLPIKKRKAKIEKKETNIKKGKDNIHVSNEIIPLPEDIKETSILKNNKKESKGKENISNDIQYDESLPLSKLKRY